MGKKRNAGLSEPHVFAVSRPDIHSVFGILRGCIRSAVLIFLSFQGNTLIGQTPQPCTAPPGGPGCLCTTAGILCTPDLLDGFTFSMSSTPNFGGLPTNDLCPGSNSDAGVPNNVNWFGFIAWCTDLEIDIHISNCQPAPGSNSYGVQIGLFGSCGSGQNGWNTVECITNSGPACGNSSNYPTLQTIDVSGLTIGNVYYFMLDGCLGSYCDIMLDVIGTCGTGVIDPWTTGITGPDTTCVGNTDTYTAEDLDGAVEFYYYLDGVLIDDGTELLSTSITWTTPGTYTLCVDVSNLPCIPESDPPAPDCMDIVVCPAADAGTISIMTTPACPGETINYSVTGQTTGPDAANYLIITDNAGNIIQVTSGTSGSITHDDCEVFNIYSYNVKANVSPPTVGTVFPADYPCTDNCCDFVEDILEFKDIEAPVFANTPADVTLDCVDDLPATAALDWTDNCAGTGTALPVEVGMADLCSGGLIRRDYEAEDDCGNVVTFSQSIIVNPIPPPVYQNPPADTVIDCDAIPTTVPDLFLDNGGSSTCKVSGFVSGTSSGSADLCGGSITHTWMYTDTCGNPVNHSRTFTVNPVPTATFSNPPADITVNCSNIPNSAPDLMYSNGASGACLIEGIITPVMNGSGDICGGTIEFVWEYTDMCNNTITHTQNVTIDPIPQAAFVNPPADVTVDCNSLPGAAPDLMYTNGETGNCLIEGMVSPTTSGSGDICGGTITHTWEFVDQCSRTITHTQTITIDPIPQAAFVNPPADATVDCNSLPGAAPDLMYTNGETGNCLIEGMVSPTTSGSGDICGGSITHTWTFVDQCNRNITHNQTITIDPIPQAAFVNPPADITVECSNIPGAPGDLMYTNGETGNCLIDGMVSPTTVDNSMACGGTIVHTWTFTDQCNRNITHVQTITINPAPQAAYISPPADITVACDAIPSGAPDLMLSNGGTGNCLIEATVPGVQIGTPNPCGGSFQYQWTHTDNCNRVTTYTQNISVTPAPPAVFAAPPPDITVDCSMVPAPGIPLTYTNGGSGICAISGQVFSTRTGNYTACGGVINDQWNFTDPCGRSISASRSITVNPAPPAVWINPPGDITVNCEDINNIVVLLSYGNGESGPCQIAGDVDAIATNNYDFCGGTITHTWTFTDACNRNIIHNRTVTVNPTPPPNFISLPADVTLGCDETYTPPSSLEYTNGLIGACENYGLAPLFSNTVGNVTTNEWSFNDACTGAIISHTQTVTAAIPVDLVVDPLTDFVCLGSFYDLSSLDIYDANNTNPTITFHLATPPTNFNLIDPPLVDPLFGTTYYIFGDNIYGCGDIVPFVLFVDDPIPAGDDVDVTICKNGMTIDLFDYLAPNADPNGNFYIFELTPLDISDPSSVNINNVPPDIYTIHYITFDNGSCPGDTAVLTLDIQEDVDFEILDVSCSSDNSTYTVTISTTDNTVTASAGTVVVIDANTVAVEDIPISTSVTITLDSNSSDCMSVWTGNPPNCNCPNIPVPTGTPSYKVCQDDVPVTMTVTVGAGLTANWYNTQAGMVPLASKVLTYQHTNATPGLYSYYVEAIDTVTNCVSQNRLKIDVEVVRRPNVVNVNPRICDDDYDGFAAFDLNAIKTTINNNPNNTINFYVSQSDADAETNPLPSPYTNTSADQVIFAVVKNPTGCIAQATATLTVLPLPRFDLNIQDETCLGDADGSIEITNVVAAGIIRTRLDGGMLDTVFLYDNLAVKDYALRVVDSFNCRVDTTVTIKQGLRVNFANFMINCNNNGTLSDASDDYYTYSFEVTTNNMISGNYIVFLNGTEVGRNAYGNPFASTIPADGSTLILEIRDEVTGCKATRNIGPLNACSTSCIISIDALETDCDNNGTDDNPADDFYTVTMTVSAVNGSSSNMYRLFVDGTLRAAYNYNQQITFTIPATGNDVTILVQDNTDSQCQATQTLTGLNPCSDGCLVNLSLLDYFCDNNGTILDKDDDFYTLKLKASAVNTMNATYNLYVDGTLNSSGNYTDTITLILPADGAAHLIYIEDAARPECNNQVTSPLLTNCSTDCDITVVVSNIICNNNGTNNTTADDTYTFDVLITGGKGNMWRIPSLSLTGNYGQLRNLGPFPISGGNLSFNVVDIDIAECVKNVNVTAPPACSQCVQTMSISADGTIDCSNPEVGLTATVSAPGTYAWTFNGGLVSNDLTAEAGSEGYYVFTATFSDGCSLIDSVFVESDDGIPVANGGPDKVLNCDIASVVLNGNMSTQGGTITYEWTNAAGQVLGTGLTLTVTQPGTYFLQVFDTSNNCTSAKDRVVVTENKDLPSVAIYANPSDIFDCIIASIILTTDNEPNVTYTWITPEAVFNDVDSVEIVQIGDYILIATNLISNCIDTGSILITSFQEYPIVELDVSGFIDCDDSEVIISSAGSQSGPTISYNWYNPSGQVFSQTEGDVTVTEPGEYTLILSDSANGCTNGDSIEVETMETVVEIDIDPIIEVVKGEKIILRPQVNIPLSDIKTIIWDPTSGLSCTDCLEPEVLVTENVTYTVTIIDIFGCEGTATVSLRAKIKNIVTVPNIIRPDGGTGNETFSVFTSDEGAVINRVMIFDRWGNKVYTSDSVVPNDPNSGWDGKFNGKYAVPGVYVYVVDAVLSTGQVVKLTGDVTLIR